MSVTEEIIFSGPSAPVGAGKQRRVRLAEAFFRRWPILLVPIIVLAVLGAYQATKVSKTFTSAGSLSVVSSTALSQINGNGSQSGGYESIATTTAREINELMGTDAFATTVADNAQLTGALKSGQVTLAQVRSYVSAGASGDNIVKIGANTPFADLSQKLAQSLVTSYRDHVLSNETGGLTGAVTFLTSELSDAQGKLDAANGALDDFVQQHPSPVSGNRPDEEQLQLSRLNAAVDSAQQSVNSFQDKLNEANLQLRQSQSDIDQRYRVVDTPEIPTAPNATKIQQLVAFMVFLFLGVAIAASMLVVIAMLDHTVRTTADVSSIPGLAVLAAIPRHRPRPPSRGKAVPAGVDAASGGAVSTGKIGA